jgi:radical SAM superfamily enzyme YgiQ (UPF0313 family)
MEAGIDLSLYVILGIGGKERTVPHAKETARVLNAISPDFIRLRTFVPKTNTPLLEDVNLGVFRMLTPHETLEETAMLVKNLTASSHLLSDHYTNYVNIQGKLPGEKEKLLVQLEDAMKMDESAFRPFFIGSQ